MPKEQQDVNAAIWAIISKHCNQGSVAKVPKGPEQLEEINRRLAALSKDMATLGAAVTPIAIQAALDVNDDTFNRWRQGKASQRDEKGNHVDVSLEQSRLDDGEKAYIISRAEIIKKYLQQGEMLASTAAQTRDNRENGGSLFILQNVYGYGQDKGKEQVTFTLEDMLTAYHKIKERESKA